MTEKKADAEKATAADDGSDTSLPLIAYPVSPLDMPLMVAPAVRDWMTATAQHFAKRCLPLLIANRAGSLLISMHKFSAIWGREPGTDSLKVQHLSGTPPYSAHSHFGSGILTFTMPFLFRTPPGINLLVRGPSNMPKDGISPLEGIVETDWTEATFTMNWKMTRPNHLVTFERGEPIAMIVPQRRGDLERFDPVIRDIATDAKLMNAYMRWMESREAHNEGMKDPSSEAYRRGWEKTYFDGKDIPDHQLKIVLKNFSEEPPRK
jgi:Family of unknown function (DUF6065)